METSDPSVSKAIHLLDSLYPDRRKLSMLSLRSACPLSLIDNLVYSWLVYRARIDAGANASQIAKHARLHRSKTVRRSLRKLADLQLITKRGGKYYAEPPRDDWFVYARREGPWYKRLIYWRLLLPSASNPLTTSVALWSLLHSKALRDGMVITAGVKQAAALLHVSPKTVRSSLRRLEQHGFIKERTLIPPAELKTYDPAWWQPADPRVRGDNSDELLQHLSQALPKVVTAMEAHGISINKRVDEIGRQALRAGYDYKRFSALFLAALDAFTAGNRWHKRWVLCMDMVDLIREADRETAANRTKGKGDFPNSLGLLKWKLQRKVTKMGGKWIK